VPRPLPIALIQAAPHPIDAPIEDFATDVQNKVDAYDGTRLFVYPELHLHGADDAGRETNQRLHDSAEPLDGPRVKALGQIAGDLGIWLVPGSVCERGSDGLMYNTALAFSPQGELVASYRKIFPWRPYEPYEPGDRFVTFELEDFGRVGFSICYDSWFPEVTRHLAWMGAEVVINLVKTTTSDRAQELVLARANAIVNQVFMLSVNCAGPVGRGQSLIVDPEGLVRAEATSENPTILSDTIDVSHVQRVHTFGTAGTNRMWDQFHPGDNVLELPLYGGRIDPLRWNPSAGK